jgi:hypothetical protein
MHAVRRLLPAFAAATLLCAASLVHAQAAVDAEKQKVIDQILTLWHPENSVVMAAQRPGADALEKTRIALQQAQLPQARFDAEVKDITTDVQKYIDTVTPLAADSARRNLPTTVVPLLAQNFSVDELRQLLVLLQSPVKAKFEKLIPQADKAIGLKVQQEAGPEITKHIQEMTKAVGTKLRADLTAATTN